MKPLGCIRLLSCRLPGPVGAHRVSLFLRPMNTPHFDLQEAARQAMLQRGFEPDFPAAVQQQVTQLQHQQPDLSVNGKARDLRHLMWSSIDNDTSRDLDQIEVVERLSNGQARVLVGIADVDTYVPKGTPIDIYAAKETTTVYTGVRIFPMLPEQLSTDATSLLEGADKLAIVIEFVVDAAGCVLSSDLYRALVRNQAQLTYNAVGAWLENNTTAPPKVAASTELQAQLRLQDQIAQSLKSERFRHGALNIETIETRPVLLNEKIVDIVKQEKNRATDLIEDFMISANGVVARRLENVSSIRRIVKTPERWDRIVQLASEHGGHLPPDPDSKSLNDFLTAAREKDATTFPDLSMAVIKLMGPGEYVLERPRDPETGHFGLAVQDYTHSTAPNRRFADIVTQRILKAELAGEKNPYSDSELQSVAQNCTLKENDARKVERDMSKRIAAVAMSGRIGNSFDAVVSGVTSHGTFVRVASPHIEGMLAQGSQGLDVGDKLRVRLIRTDPQHGFIDFARA